MSWGEVLKAASVRTKCSFRGGPGLGEPPLPLHPREGGEGVQISVLLGTPLKDLQNWGFVRGLRLVGRTQDARRQAGEGITASGGGGRGTCVAGSRCQEKQLPVFQGRLCVTACCSLTGRGDFWGDP